MTEPRLHVPPDKVKETEETETHRPMNGWEALTKITANVSFTVIMVALIGLVYLITK